MTRRSLRSLPRDAWAGAMLLVSSLFFLAHLLGSQAEGVTAHVSASTLPTLLVSVLALLGLLMLVGAWREWRKGSLDAPPSQAAGELRSAWRVWVLIGATAAYIALLPLLGYFVCTAGYIGAMALLFGNRRAVVVLPLMLLVPLVLMLFFERFMIIPLPSSSLFG